MRPAGALRSAHDIADALSYVVITMKGRHGRGRMKNNRAGQWLSLSGPPQGKDGTIGSH